MMLLIRHKLTSGTYAESTCFETSDHMSAPSAGVNQHTSCTQGVMTGSNMKENPIGAGGSALKLAERLFMTKKSSSIISNRTIAKCFKVVVRPHWCKFAQGKPPSTALPTVVFATKGSRLCHDLRDM